jgi:creatinine amidohydrolase
MKKVLWQEMRRIEIEEASKVGAVVIIPVGSIEQHGNHLPVNTDINCSFSIAKATAEIIDDFPVLVVPPIWGGLSPHHMKYPGTISLKLHTYIDVLTEVATSIAAHGFKKIAFLNGHGGNIGVMNSIRLKLMENNGPSCIAYTYFRLVDKELKAISEVDSVIGHAAEMETSLQLYLQPELVDKGAATWVPGVFGDPTKGTYEKGKRLFEVAVDTVVMLIQDYHSNKLEDPWDALTWKRNISPEQRKYT